MQPNTSPPKRVVWREILLLHHAGVPRAEIVRITDCSVPYVRAVLSDERLGKRWLDTPNIGGVGEALTPVRAPAEPAMPKAAPLVIPVAEPPVEPTAMPVILCGEVVDCHLRDPRASLGEIVSRLPGQISPPPNPPSLPRTWFDDLHSFFFGWLK